MADEKAVYELKRIKEKQAAFPFSFFIRGKKKQGKKKITEKKRKNACVIKEDFVLRAQVNKLLNEW